MRPRDRVRRWKLAGGSSTVLAEELGVADTSITRALSGKTLRPDRRIAQAIADVIGVELETAFPHLAERKRRAAHGQAA